jgi:hypothetical protein
MIGCEIISGDSFCFSFAPEELQCGCSTETAEIEIIALEAKLLMADIFVPVECKSWKCKKCEKLSRYKFNDEWQLLVRIIHAQLIFAFLVRYDGANDCILNWNSKWLICHEIIQKRQDFMFCCSKFNATSTYVDSNIIYQ